MDRRKLNKGKARITYDREGLLKEKEKITAERNALRAIGKSQDLTVKQNAEIERINRRVSYLNILLDPERLEKHRRYNLAKFRRFSDKKRNEL